MDLIYKVNNLTVAFYFVTWCLNGSLKVFDEQFKQFKKSGVEFTRVQVASL